MVRNRVYWVSEMVSEKEPLLKVAEEPAKGTWLGGLEPCRRVWPGIGAGSSTWAAGGSTGGTD